MNTSRNNRSQLQVRRSPEVMDFSPKPVGNQASQLRRQDNRDRFIAQVEDGTEKAGQVLRSSFKSAGLIEGDPTDRNANYKFGKRFALGAAALIAIVGTYAVTANTTETESVILDPSELGHNGPVNETDYGQIAATYADKVHSVDPTAGAYDFAYDSLVNDGQITIDSDDATFGIAKQLDKN